jgi:hypothetical protein
VRDSGMHFCLLKYWYKYIIRLEMPSCDFSFFNTFKILLANNALKLNRINTTPIRMSLKTQRNHPVMNVKEIRCK